MLNSVKINTLHVGMIELFYRAAITYIRYIITDIGCSRVAVRYVIHEWTKFEHCIASIQQTN